MSQFYTALVFPLILLVGQAIVALGQRKISQRMDEGQAKRNQVKVNTDAKQPYGRTKHGTPSILPCSNSR